MSVLLPREPSRRELLRGTFSGLGFTLFTEHFNGLFFVTVGFFQ